VKERQQLLWQRQRIKWFAEGMNGSMASQVFRQGKNRLLRQ
jgi:hypothetical protein